MAGRAQEEASKEREKEITGKLWRYSPMAGNDFDLMVVVLIKTTASWWRPWLSWLQWAYDARGGHGGDLGARVRSSWGMGRGETRQVRTLHGAWGSRCLALAAALLPCAWTTACWTRWRAAEATRGGSKRAATKLGHRMAARFVAKR